LLSGFTDLNLPRLDQCQGLEFEPHPSASSSRSMASCRTGPTATRRQEPLRPGFWGHTLRMSRLKFGKATACARGAQT